MEELSNKNDKLKDELREDTERNYIKIERNYIKIDRNHKLIVEELSNKNDRLKEELKGDIERNHSNIRLIERNIDNMKIDIDSIKIKQEQGLELSRRILNQLEQNRVV